MKEQRSNSINNFYNCLCDLYTSDKSDSLFDFNGIMLPKPMNREEKIEFFQEFLDMLAPKIVKDKTFCNIVTIEGPYELGEVQVKTNDVVIDCGANMGLFSAIASNKGATVYAFEPGEFIIENYLSKTASINPNIEICKFALSNEERLLYFSQNVNKPASSRILNTSSLNSERVVTVQATTIDNFVQERNIPQVDFIKADIEGAERYMLMGARQVLKEYAPKISICTYHLPDDPKVLRELILDANPNYIIEERFEKMYAYVKVR